MAQENAPENVIPLRVYGDGAEAHSNLSKPSFWI